MIKIVITGLVIVHLAASLWHGSAHTRLGIELSTEQTLFVYILVIIAPVAAAILAWTRYVSMGLSIVVLSLYAGKLSLWRASPLRAGVARQYSPFAGRRSRISFHFVISAGVIALLELASALYGAFCVGTYHVQARTRA
jgi:hypothetical protein